MVRYFIHLRDGTEELLDPEGLEFPTLDSLRKTVLASARDLMTLPFEPALPVNPEAGREPYARTG